MLERKFDSGLVVTIAAVSLLTLSRASFASSVLTSVKSTCQFTLVNADQPGEYVRAHCTALDKLSDPISINFEKGAGFAYVRSRVGLTLRCDVRMEKIGQQPVRYGVFDCHEKSSSSSQSTGVRSVNQ